jgi:hypothetical protein
MIVQSPRGEGRWMVISEAALFFVANLWRKTTRVSLRVVTACWSAAKDN